MGSYFFSSSTFSLGFLIFYLLLFATSNLGQTTALESNENDVSKVKCREQVEEALKQYWNHEKQPTESDYIVSSEDKPTGVTDSNEDSDEDDDSQEETTTTVEQGTESPSTKVDESPNSETDEQSSEDNNAASKPEDDDANDATDDSDEDEDDGDDTTEDGNAAEGSDETTETEAKEEAGSDEDASTNTGEEAAVENKEEVDKSDEEDQDSDSKDDSDTKEDNQTVVKNDDGSDEKTEDSNASNETADDNDEDDDGSDEDEDDTNEDATETATVENNTNDDTSDGKESAEADEAKKESEASVEQKVEKREAPKEEKESKVAEDSKSDEDDEEDASAEGTEEEEESEEEHEEPMRSRSHIEDILKLYEIGTKEDKDEQNLIQSIYRDLKKIYEGSVKPMEQLYKYRDITTRLITDAEIFAKPLVMFLGAKGSGKTSLVNYMLGLQSTPWQLKTGLSSGAPHFTVITHGDTFTKLSPTELSADFAFSNLQQFGHYFLEHHMHAYRMPISLLQKMTIVDSPGLIDADMMGKHQGKRIDSEVYQWFIDRSDVLYIVIDVSQLQMTTQLHSIIDQMKGRDIRFIISKADSVKHSQLILLIGQLLWMLSPVMSADEPPKVYALTTSPMSQYDIFLDDQEQNWLTDLSEQITGIERVESRISAVRRHAVRVRNHAKLIDAYLGAFYRNKGLFTFGASAKKLATEITENPDKYGVFKGAVAGQMQNVSRYDLPDPEIYEDFFKINPLGDFKPLSSTCSFFKGCPMDKLDLAIAYQLPDLVGKYKKLTKTTIN